MSCLTTADHLYIRSKVTTDLDDSELEDLADDLGTTDARVVTLHLLDTEITKRESRPVQWSLVGDYTENWGATLASLKAKRDELAAEINGGVPGVPVITTASTLQRSDRNRIGENA